MFQRLLGEGRSSGGRTAAGSITDPIKGISSMKRSLTTALILGVFSTFGLIGCGEESKVKETQEVTTPAGTETKTTENKVETTGNPPVTPPGETTPPK
jgi:hypothetical protein